MAERILKAVRNIRFDLAGSQIGVTVSVGLATYPEHGRTREELIGHADKALYLAKQSGRDRFRTFDEVGRD